MQVLRDANGTTRETAVVRNIASRSGLSTGIRSSDERGNTGAARPLRNCDYSRKSGHPLVQAAVKMQSAIRGHSTRYAMQEDARLEWFK